MNKLLTALILVATAAAAQAKEVNLSCDRSDKPNTKFAVMIDADKGIGSYMNNPIKLVGKSSEFYLYESAPGVQVKINRTNLFHNIVYNGKDLEGGICQVVEFKTKI